MTKSELRALKAISKRIDSLANLENACFDFSEEKDTMIKNEIRPYMSWFFATSSMLDELITAEEGSDRYGVQNAIEQIDRYCY